MKVTLYKNCILNSHYTEVFRNKTLIDNYLDSIAPENKMTIEIDNTYMKLSDTLVFYLNGTLFDMYNYNYMVCENDNNQSEKIYCFIQSVEIGNEACKVSYICDVWSTFIGKWSLRESLVSRSRKTKPNEFYELPFLPVTNGTLFQSGQSVMDNYAIIIEFQIYNLISSDGQKIGQKNIRENYIGVFTSQESLTSFTTFTEVNAVIETVNKILSYQNAFTFTKIKPVEGKTFQAFYYEVLNCYVVPSGWINANILGDKIYSFRQFTEYDPLNIILLKNNDGLEIVESKNLLLQPSNFAIGFTSKYFPISYNSAGLTYNIEIASNNNNFKIYFNTAQIGLKEVTDCFRMELPFSTADAGTLAQQRIADNLQKVNGEINIANGITKTVAGSVDLYQSRGITGGSGNEAFERAMGWDFSYANEKPSNPTGLARGAKEVVDGLGSIYRGIAQIEAATAAKYVNTSAISNDTNCFANAYYGVSKFALARGYNEINNFSEFQKAIDETGYKVNYFVNDLDLGLNETSITDYNVVKFDFVRLIGISEEINNVISSILLNGVKIWYTINV